MNRFYFPAWTNTLLGLIGPVMTLGLIYVVAVLWFGAVPNTTDVGYAPTQPIPFSHKLHAGDLKMDCRYCHTSVEKAAFAAIPPTSTCLNCHSGKDAAGQVVATAIHSDSPKLAPVRESAATGQPIEWIKVHDLPDYAYFNHSAHVTRGVSCVSCHDRIDRMEKVYQSKELSMSWCLSCHRNPDPHLRPAEFVTKLDWAPPEGKTAAEVGREIREQRGINPSTNCSTCHR
ncbi:cytochrome c3 family protein [bacterium]|nr:cytochrome c3 family protein [bacterium]